MVADVPVGAFLSGGIDSSTVLAIMQQLATRPAKSFTIGFREEGYSEADHAAAVARHLGTEHTELYLQPEDALELVPGLPYVFDEPFADSSQLPTILVSQLARRHVTVALSGDAGDELFCGYNRYMWWRRMWMTTHRGPRWPWRVAASVGMAISPTTWNTVLNPTLRLLPSRWRHPNPGDRIHKLAQAIREDDPARLYLRFISHWNNPEEIVIGGREPQTLANSPSDIRDPDAYTENMMYLDAVTYLPDDIMVKVDRSSMSVSLEARAPLLDYRIVEFAASLPLDFKLQGLRGKRVLRDVLYKYVPQSMVDRPKTGFGVPIDSWLRGPLREWAEDLLSESRLRSSGVFSYEPVRRIWNEHLSGTRQNQYLLWDVLMFEAWLEKWRSRALAA
jgi:asparagine synthase (glutamine-hydrolysing)